MSVLKSCDLLAERVLALIAIPPRVGRISCVQGRSESLVKCSDAGQFFRLPTFQEPTLKMQFLEIESLETSALPYEDRIEGSQVSDHLRNHRGSTAFICRSRVIEWKSVGRGEARKREGKIGGACVSAIESVSTIPAHNAHHLREQRPPDGSCAAKDDAARDDQFDPGSGTWRTCDAQPRTDAQSALPHALDPEIAFFSGGGYLGSHSLTLVGDAENADVARCLPVAQRLYALLTGLIK